MVEQVEDVGGAQLPIGAVKPLSDEVRASLQAVRAAQEAARARIRRQTVRTRAWFGAIVGVIGLGLIFVGPRVGRRVTKPAPKPSVAALSPAAVTPPPSAVAAPAPSVVARESRATDSAPPSTASAQSTASVQAPADAPALTAPAARETAVASRGAGGCTIAAGQARWRADAEACAKIFEGRPSDAALALTIAHAYHARGHLAQAGEWAKRAIALDSHSAEAFVILARAETRAGRSDAATKAYRSYLDLAPRGWHSSEARAAVRRSEQHARRSPHADPVASAAEGG